MYFKDWSATAKYSIANAGNFSKHLMHEGISDSVLTVQGKYFIERNTVLHLLLFVVVNLLNDCIL